MQHFVDPGQGVSLDVDFAQAMVEAKRLMLITKIARGEISLDSPDAKALGLTPLEESSITAPRCVIGVGEQISPEIAEQLFGPPSPADLND